MQIKEVEKLVEMVFPQDIDSAPITTAAARQVLTAAAARYPGADLATFLRYIEDYPASALADLVAETDAAVYLLETLRKSVRAALSTRIRAYIAAN